MSASRSILTILSVTISHAASGQETLFSFGGNANGIAGLESADLVDNGVTMSLAVTPVGGVFNENSTSGLGINSRGVTGAIDGSNDKFDVLGGTLAGQSDGVRFSFDTDGLLTELYFDGVKDESFEFFTLTTPSGVVYSIFDSQIGLRLIDINSVTEPNVTLLSETGGADDDLFGLAIPFAAGEVFTLVYGEYFPEPSDLPVGFTPDQGNGARFQGVEIVSVPEPSGLLIALLTLVAGGLRNACHTC